VKVDGCCEGATIISSQLDRNLQPVTPKINKEGHFELRDNCFLVC